MPLRLRLDGFLRARARDLLVAREALLPPLQAELAALTQAQEAAARAAMAAALAAKALQADLAVLTRPQFSADMTLDQVWRRHPGVRALFAARHLPACDGCALRHDETLAEAADAYDLDLSVLLVELNALIPAQPPLSTPAPS